MAKRIKRAPAGTKAIAVSGDLWNALCDLVERSQIVSVAAPLFLQDTPAGKVLGFHGGEDKARWVKVTSDRDSHGGEYGGRVSVGEMEDADGNLTLPQAMTYPDADDCVIYNEEENEQPTHWLKKPSYALGIITGQITTGDDAGKFIVSIQCGNPRVESPEDLASAPSTATDADTKSWDRRDEASEGDAKGDCPITIQFNSRPNEDSEADGEGVITTYSFWRTATIDASGKWVSVSAETRVTESESEPACPEEE